MPLTPDPPFPKSRNDTIRSKDWNDAVQEVVRLEAAKVDRGGDTVTGPLTVLGALGVAGPGGPRHLLVGDDVAGLGFDPSDAGPNAGYLRFGDNTGWKLHVGRSREAAGGAPNTDLTGVLATFQDDGKVGIGTVAPASRLQVDSLTAIDQGGTADGAWANFGSNAHYDGQWNRVDPAKAGVNLHMNADGGGVEFRFLRVEADGTNLRNIAQIGTSGTSVNEGILTVGGTAPNNWKAQIFNSTTGGDNAFGVLAQVSADTGGAFGAEFSASANGGNTVAGVLGVAGGNGSGTKIGVYGSSSGPGPLWAGYFAGNVTVAGALSKGSGSFLIDHPLDPANKTLRHNLVESPEHLCLYRGTTGLDGAGSVELPDYFAALTDEANATVHLTPVGERPEATGYRWNDGHTAFDVFGSPGGEVAYLVLAARDDPVIHQLGRPVEEEKGGDHLDQLGQGEFLYPEAFGHPAERGVAFSVQESLAAARPPEAAGQAVAPIAGTEPGDG